MALALNYKVSRSSSISRDDTNNITTNKRPNFESQRPSSVPSVKRCMRNINTSHGSVLPVTENKRLIESFQSTGLESVTAKSLSVEAWKLAVQ